ncbi:hypothetical protein GGS26DRAFT_297383 [Hypomontagnella submonticulosa]|nr:hypothetical protein GGS26DRAFT_297383 [Hypomontagnella submonticulosa]
MTTTTPTVTLPAGWTPSSSGCLRTTDFWIWDYPEDRNQRTVLGGPSQTDNCFPSTWNPTLTYEGSGCPPQYTSACQGPDSTAPVTCCPTAYAFSCIAETDLGIHSADTFRCVSKHNTGGTIVVTRTAFKPNTIAIETRTRKTNEHLFALAMIYKTPTSMPTSTLPTDSSSTITGTSMADGDSAAATPSGESTSGLGAGAAAGIGVGAGLVVLLIVGFVAWYLLRRRRTTFQELETPPAPPPPPMTPATPTTYATQDGVSMYSKPTELSAVPHEIHELDGR